MVIGSYDTAEQRGRNRAFGMVSSVVERGEVVGGTHHDILGCYK
jgi:hypothetical protein